MTYFASKTANRYYLEKAEELYNDINKQLNLEKVLEETLSTQLEREKYVEFNHVDLYFETTTAKFIEVFGADKLLTATKDESAQKVICEIHGNTHICKPTGGLNLRTYSKMNILKQLGYNVTFATSQQLKPLALSDAASKSQKVIELLKQNMNNF